jgi:hypothetical protein
MPQIITIEGKRVTATLFASNLIFRRLRDVVFLTAYGPTQEVRAFGQLLTEDGANLKVPEIATLRSVRPEGTYRIIPNLPNGYSAIYTLPSTKDYLLGDSKEECFGIFSRILDQTKFVHRDWYEDLFAVVTEEVPPTIGEKRCFRLAANIEKEVAERIRSGAFRFPASTADLILDAADSTGTKPVPDEEAFEEDTEY